MKKIKNLFKGRSKLLLIIVIAEMVLSGWFLCYFNYLDRLSYSESIATTTDDLALLVQNMYTSTWWALIILTICIITICSLICYIYKDLKFQFCSLCLWFVLMILAIDIKNSFINNYYTFLIFVPLIGFNVVAFINQKKLNK